MARHMKCYGCGAEKDLDIYETYIGALEDIDNNSPIQPLFVMECQEHVAGGGKWKVVVICHSCYDKLEPDMWISRDMWDGIKPSVSFTALPDIPIDNKNLNINYYFDNMAHTNIQD